VRVIASINDIVLARLPKFLQQLTGDLPMINVMLISLLPVPRIPFFSPPLYFNLFLQRATGA
jgi:hypothetical protein